MKLDASICVLILLNFCIVGSSSLDFGSLFRRGNYGTPLRAPYSSPDVEEVATYKLLDNEEADEDTPMDLLEYRSELDPYVFNSTSDGEFTDSVFLNSSAHSNETNQSDATNNSTSESSSISTSDKSGSFLSTELYQSGEVHSSILPDYSTKTIGHEVLTSARVESTTLGEIASANYTTEEQEEVVLGTKETTILSQRTIFQKSIDWVEDEYTLSILIPISAGIIFALTIICTIATCRCMRRSCRRRRFRKKCLPDSIKSLRPSDRARLLGDTSDEEF